MKRLMNLIGLIAAICTAVLLQGCKHDDEPVTVSCSGLTVISSCSPDLLEFVTPVITITDSNGEESTYRLTQDDYQEIEDGKPLTVEYQTGIHFTRASDIKNNIAIIRKAYNSQIKFASIKVQYERKPECEISKDSYIFFNAAESYLFGNVITFSKQVKKLDVGGLNYYNIFPPTPKAETFTDEASIELYLSFLCNFSKTYTLTISSSHN